MKMYGVLLCKSRLHNNWIRATKKAVLDAMDDEIGSEKRKELFKKTRSRKSGKWWPGLAEIVELEVRLKEDRA